MRDDIINIADKAQRYMIVFGIDPACTRQPATQHGQRAAHVGGNVETGEEARHGASGSIGCAYKTSREDSHVLRDAHITRLSRARRTSSSTLGRIRATIASTPAAVGWSPSP